MRRWLGLIGLVAGCLVGGWLVSGCAPVVHTDFDRSFDFTQLKRYEITPVDESDSGFEMLSGALVGERVRVALDKALHGRDFIAAKDADFRIGYRFDGKREGYGDSSFYYRPTIGGAGFTWSDPLRYREHEILVMTISIYDSKPASRLLWRGAAEEIWSKSSTDAEYLDALIDSLVTTIMQRFPPAAR